MRGSRTNRLERVDVPHPGGTLPTRLRSGDVGLNPSEGLQAVIIVERRNFGTSVAYSPYRRQEASCPGLRLEGRIAGLA